MPQTGRRSGTWVGATADTILSGTALAIVWYPLVFYSNALLGTPLGTRAVTTAVGVLAVGTAYPFVARSWSLGDLGEYLFLLLATAFAWGFVIMAMIGVSGQQFSGSNSLPRVIMWGLAYLSAYFVVRQTDVTVFSLRSPDRNRRKRGRIQDSFAPRTVSSTASTPSSWTRSPTTITSACSPI